KRLPNPPRKDTSSGAPSGKGKLSSQVLLQIQPVPPLAFAPWWAMKCSSINPGAREELIVFVVSQIRLGTVIGPTCSGENRCSNFTLVMDVSFDFPSTEGEALRARLATRLMRVRAERSPR